MKKKVLACTLAAMMCASMLAGCGSDSGNAGSTGNGGDVTLKVWCPQNQVDTIPLK